MTIESVLYTRLTTHAGLSALTALRVYPNVLPQNVSYPAISFRRVSSERPSAMGSDIGLVRARFQFDVWAESYDLAPGARTSAEQVRLALQRWSDAGPPVVQEVFFLNDLDLFEPQTALHHVALDFEVNYEE